MNENKNVKKTFHKLRRLKHKGCETVNSENGN